MVDGIHLNNDKALSPDSSERFELPEFEGLCHLQRRFVECYVQDPKHNGTQAVIDAGYQVKNRNTAGVMANELLRNPKIFMAIRAYQEKIGGPNDLDRIMHVLWSIIETDITEVFQWDGRGGYKITPSNKLSRQAALAISSIQIIKDDGQMPLPGLEECVKDGKGGKANCQVKFHSKEKAIDILARIKGWYAPEKMELSGSLLTETLDKARERVGES